MAHFRDGLPVGAERLRAKQVGGHLLHARFPQLVLAIADGCGQQIQGLFEVATEVFQPD